MGALTVVMPVYNAMPYLPVAVESILGQSFRDFKFLIIDDGSTDGSRDYLEGLRDTRICLDCQNHSGLQFVLNRSLELVETNLYARMDADDIAMPDRLGLQCAFMRDHPKVVLAGTQVNYLAGGRTLSGPPLPINHQEIVKGLLLGHAAIRHPTCMMRTEAIRALGGYRLLYSEDHDLFLRLSERGALANLPELLLSYRIGLGSTFATQARLYIAYRAYSIACYRARERLQPEPPLAEFTKAWERCGVVGSVRRRVDAWSALQYRRSLIELGEGRRMNATLRMAAAALCRPRALLHQMASRLQRGISRPV